MRKVSKLLPIYLLSFLLFSYQEKAKLTVVILPLGDVKKEDVQIIKHSIKNYYNVEVHSSEKEPIKIELYSSKGDTIDAIKAISYLETIKLNGNAKLIAFTEKGLTLNNGNFIIRGFAKMNGKCAIISSKKIYNESVSIIQYKNLLTKVSLHEVGHTLGLNHCDDSDDCFMLDTYFKPELFLNSGLSLCSKCKHKVLSYVKK
jgi:archaemetzincin